MTLVLVIVMVGLMLLSVSVWADRHPFDYPVPPPETPEERRRRIENAPENTVIC